jgi:hypothetical protein
MKPIEPDELIEADSLYELSEEAIATMRDMSKMPDAVKAAAEGIVSHVMVRAYRTGILRGIQLAAEAAAERHTNHPVVGTLRRFACREREEI